MAEQTKIKIEAIVNAPVEKVWELWNNPADIIQWNSADPSWHTPRSENDLRVDGKFKHRMEAKDGSFGFDFEGIYTKVDLHQEISYVMADGRTATTLFINEAGKTALITFFDPENENDPELQRQGWQAILNSFVRYAESKNTPD